MFWVWEYASRVINRIDDRQNYSEWKFWRHDINRKYRPRVERGGVVDVGEYLRYLNATSASHHKQPS